MTVMITVHRAGRKPLLKIDGRSEEERAADKKRLERLQAELDALSTPPKTRERVLSVRRCRAASYAFHGMSECVQAELTRAASRSDELMLQITTGDWAAAVDKLSDMGRTDLAEHVANHFASREEYNPRPPKPLGRDIY